MDEQIEQLIAEYRDQRAKVDDVQRRIADVSTTVTAPKQVVEVTVSGQGEVTGIAFPTGAYKRMPPKELADVLIATLGEARTRSVQQVAALVAEQLPAGGIPDGFRNGGGKISDGPDDLPIPDIVREYLEHGKPTE
jgi:DNA-binding protein YbaB